MSLKLNLAPNGIMAPALGYPFRLDATTDYYCTGVVPLWATSIDVSAKADKQADLHLALFSAPLLAGGADGPLLLQVDMPGVLNGNDSIALAVPTLAPGASITPDGTITIPLTVPPTVFVTGSSTAFPLDGQWNGLEIATKGGAWFQIAAVTSATALTLVAAATSASAGAFYVRRPQPAAYVFSMWADNVVGGSIETVLRDAAVTVAATQAQVPGGVTVASVVVS